MNQLQRLARQLRRPVVDGVIRLDATDHNLVARSGSGWRVVWLRGGVGGGTWAPRWKDVKGALWLLRRDIEPLWVDDEEGGSWRAEIGGCVFWYRTMRWLLRCLRADLRADLLHITVTSQPLSLPLSLPPRNGIDDAPMAPSPRPAPYISPVITHESVTAWREYATKEDA